MPSRGDLIAAFSGTARPIMRRFMPAASCIASARTTIETMRILGLRAKAIPVAYAFSVPARNYARISGFSAEEREAMKAKCASWKDVPPGEGGGWNGHLVVLVQDRWILDPSLDQADAPQFGVSIPPEVFFVDLAGRKWNPNEQFQLEMGLVLDNGDRATLTYRRIDDHAYLETEAWKDEGLPLLAHVIANQLGGAL